MPAARSPAHRSAARQRLAAPPIPQQRRPIRSDDAPIPTFAAASLTQRRARSGRLCDGCGNERLTEIQMTLTDGTLALFCSCHRCEHKSWRAAQTGTLIDVSFDAVLNRTRKVR